MSADTHPSDDNMLARRRILGAAYRLFYDQPLAAVRGEGVWLYDTEGKQYLDCYNNVPVVGHCNPAVVSALTEQARLLNTHTRYLHEKVIRYAERLRAKFPASLDTVMLTCTGSEANDLALRIAFAATGRTGVIVSHNAYHGVTKLIADISPSLHDVATNVRTVPAPTQLAGSEDSIAQQFAHSVGEAAQSLNQAGTPVAALIVDTVFASDGLYTGGALLSAAAQAVHAHGGLFIADEVQGGFTRTGSDWWAFQRDAVVPDLVTLGKPMGNGHPMAGLVTRAELIESFNADCRYFNTFGGNTVSAAVGLAVLDELERLDAPRHVDTVGAHLGEALRSLAAKSPLLGSVRGRGLYWAVDIRDANEPGSGSRIAQHIINGMKNDGVLIGTTGRRGNTLKIRPPLIFQTEHIDRLLTSLEQQCRTIHERADTPTKTRAMTNASGHHPTIRPATVSAHHEMTGGDKS